MRPARRPVFVRFGDIRPPGSPSGGDTKGVAIERSVPFRRRNLASVPHESRRHTRVAFLRTRRGEGADHETLAVGLFIVVIVCMLVVAGPAAAKKHPAAAVFHGTWTGGSATQMAPPDGTGTWSISR